MSSSRVKQMLLYIYIYIHIYIYIYIYIQPRSITLKEELKAQTPARQTIKKGKSPQREQNSRSPSRNPSQTNQSDRNKEISRLQPHIESLRRQDTNTKNEKQQLNNQNYRNQNSHSKNSVPVSVSVRQTQNVFKF